MKLDKLIDKCKFFHKIARKQDDLNILKDNIGNYIHFSNSNRFGISFHKDVHPGNPRGLYGFPLTQDAYQKILSNNFDGFDGFGERLYIYIFSVPGKILDLDNINLNEEVEKVKAFIENNYPRENFKFEADPAHKNIKAHGWKFMDWIRLFAHKIFKNEQSGINIILRGIGYDALKTNREALSDMIESQIVVINPTAANLIAKINNPMLTKEDIKSINWYQSEEYKQQSERKRREQESQDQERLNQMDLLNKEREMLNKMEQDLREERKRTGSTPEYLQKLDLHLELTKKLNEKWKRLF